MPGPPTLKPLDPDNWRIACELSELAYALRPWKLEPGVYKFRSAEEMWRHQEEQEKKRLRASRSGR